MTSDLMGYPPRNAIWLRRLLLVAFIDVIAASHHHAVAQEAANASFSTLYAKLHPQIEALDAKKEYAKADRLMQRLLDTAQKSFGPQGDMTIYLLHDHMSRLQGRGEPRAALPFAKELIPLLSNRGDKLANGPRMLRHVLLVAILASESGTQDEHLAARNWLAQLDTLASDIKPGDDDYGGLVAARFSVATATNDQKLAIEVRRRLLAHVEAQSGEESPAAIQASGRLALELTKMADSASTKESKRLADRIAAKYAEVPSVRNRGDFIAMAQLAGIYAKGDDERQAQAAVKRIVTSPISFDPHAPGDLGLEAEVVDESLMSELNGIAITCRELKRTSVAVPLFRYVISKRTEKQLEENSEVLRAKSGLGRALLMEGQKDEGLALVTEAYETATKKPDVHKHYMAALELAFAIGLEFSGAHEAACRQYAAAVDRHVALETNDVARRQVVQLYASGFAEALEQNGRSDEAAELRRKAEITSK